MTAAADMLDAALDTPAPAAPTTRDINASLATRGLQLIKVGYWCPDCEAEELTFVDSDPHAELCPFGGADVEAVYRIGAVT